MKEWLTLNEISIEFDGAEEKNFWFISRDDSSQVSISEAKKLKKFLEDWLNKIEEVKH